MKKYPRDKNFSIVLPFFNEEKIVEDVVRSLVLASKKNKLAMKFILVNNGSTDKTGAIISRLEKEFSQVKSIMINQNKGYGLGIRRGLEVCNTDYLGFMWGDGQVIPNDLVRVVKEIQNDPILDICKVLRVKRYDGWKRQLISYIYNYAFSLIFNVKIKDINGTPKLLRRSSYQKLNLVSNDWFIDAELILKASKLKMRIKEVPVKFYPRKKGSSSIGLFTGFEFLKNMILYKLGKFTLYEPK